MEMPYKSGQRPSHHAGNENSLAHVVPRFLNIFPDNLFVDSFFFFF